MTRDQFFERLRFIRTKGVPQIDKAARIEVRKAILYAIARVQKILVSGGSDYAIQAAIDKELIASQWMSAINGAIKKTAEMTVKPIVELLISQINNAGIKTKDDAIESMTEYLVEKVVKKSVKQNQKQNVKVVNAKYSKTYKQDVFGAEQGVSFYVRDPATGKIKFVERTYYTQFSKAYDLSGTVWKDVKNAEEQILNTIWAARAQGRDLAKVAKDLEGLIAGKEKILGSWGKLKPGTAEYVKRLGKAGIDYRALRITRTEAYRAMNDSIKEADKLNPATTGKFDWILTPSRDEWNCACEDYAAGGPYTEAGLPIIPAHPNCTCQIRPVLKDWEEFKKEVMRGEGLSDLTDWVSEGTAEALY
ncbi:MAG: hypothetical protein LBQ37_02505 [Elusimicrobiota bacterium]|jgi:hypothetical protein|nr:hypothetical protein [Elusimicrobiota bacterium]